MELKESAEMYLETILVIAENKNTVRSIDIADYMKVSKPAVSRAMAKLKADKYILMDSGGDIILTEAGRQVAGKIYERHTMLTNFLMLLGVDGETAAADACKMEHDISDETFYAMKRHCDKYKDQ